MSKLGVQIYTEEASDTNLVAGEITWHTITLPPAAAKGAPRAHAGGIYTPRSETPRQHPDGTKRRRRLPTRTRRARQAAENHRFNPQR